jgi:hypothetical protein
VLSLLPAFGILASTILQLLLTRSAVLLNLLWWRLLHTRIGSPGSQLVLSSDLLCSRCIACSSILTMATAAAVGLYGQLRLPPAPACLQAWLHLAREHVLTPHERLPGCRPSSLNCTCLD